MFDTSGFSVSNVLQSTLGAALQYRAQKDALRASVVSATPVGLPAVGAAAGLGGLAARLGLGGVVAAGGAVVRAGSRLIATTIGNISKKKVVAIAKQMGSVAAAAAALGLTEAAVAQLLVENQGKSGRGKGVTAASLRTTRRTMRTVERMHKQIAGYCRDAGVKGKTRVVFGGKKCR